MTLSWSMIFLMRRKTKTLPANGFQNKCTVMIFLPGCVQTSYLFNLFFILVHEPILQNSMLNCLTALT